MRLILKENRVVTDSEQQHYIAKLVSNIYNGETEKVTAIREIDDKIYELYELTPDEIALVEESVK